MSGALRKMGVYLGLVEDGERYNARYDDEYDDFDEYEDEAVDGESHETEPVPAVRAARGLHRIPELPQPVDVATHGARADVQPVGEQRPRPVPARLQQREQRQQPSRRLDHAPRLARGADRS